MTDADVKTLLDRLVAAWNSADVTAFGACFTEDTDYVTASGLWWHGRSTVERELARHGRTSGPWPPIMVAPPVIRWLGKKTALVHVPWGEDASASGPFQSPQRRGLFLLVVTREGDAPRVAAFQNTEFSART